MAKIQRAFRLSQEAIDVIDQRDRSAQYDSTKNYHAWFCGYGTNDVSEIAVCVMIEKGGAGGIVAAPVAGQIFDYYFSR